MINRTVLLNAGGHESAHMVLYLQEETPKLKIKKRPMLLICPGGGYAYTSDREAEPLAFTFLAMGLNVGIVRYSTAPEAQFPDALFELAEAVKMTRDHADAWQVDSDKILLLGCSAGGHLAASLACFYKKPFLRGIGSEEELRPNGLILCYPVITMGAFTHEGSRDNLFGSLKDAAAFGGKDLTEFLSLENEVHEDMPPVFLWTTFEDASVPMENTLLFAGALRSRMVPFELHVFPHGAHGLSLANELTQNAEGAGLQEEVSSWPVFAKAFIRTHFPFGY